MNDYKEFQGKSLDEAIKEACEFYGVSRGKLEIDIVADAKSGIFGLVGAKKACVRARKISFGVALDEALGATSDSAKPESVAPEQAASENIASGNAASGENSGRRGRKGASAAKAAPASAKTASVPEDTQDAHAQEHESSAAPHGADKKAAREEEGESAAANNRAAASGKSGAGRAPRQQGRPRAQGAKERTSGAKRTAEGAFAGRGGNEAAERSAKREKKYDAPARNGADDAPEIDLDSCDRDLLFSHVRECIGRMVGPIVGDVPCEVSIEHGRVRVVVDCGDAIGLLVGRDGQTLASIQYLAARIVSRAMGGTVHVQVDTGNYRERQDDKLKDIALALAAKVKETGKSRSTRPLSAYQRRIVHLALEADEAVATRSNGDGAQRRVVISLVSANHS